MKAKVRYLRIGGLVIVLGCLSATPRCGPAILAAQTAGDSGAIRAVVAGFEDAWNRHDMDAFAALFHQDAAWVHWRGGYWRGRDEIKRGHLTVHQTFYKNTHMQTIAIEDITFLAPVVVVIHYRNNMTGDERSPGQLLRYRLTLVLTKRDGLWRISAGHNTRLHDDIQ